MRNLKAFFLFLFIATVAGLLAWAGRSLDAKEYAQAMESPAAVPAAQGPSADTLAVRATRFDVISSCGKPTKVWMTSSGRAQYEADTWHLWYPRVPAEVLIVGYPGGSESDRHWIFAGAAISPTSDDLYDSAKLVKKMPCVSRWADVYVKLNAEIMKKYGN